MLVTINYKNWPKIIYLKYNNVKVTNKMFDDYKIEIKKSEVDNEKDN